MSGRPEVCPVGSPLETQLEGAWRSSGSAFYLDSSGEARDCQKHSKFLKKKKKKFRLRERKLM